MLLTHLATIGPSAREGAPLLLKDCDGVDGACGCDGDLTVGGVSDDVLAWDVLEGGVVVGVLVLSKLVSDSFRLTPAFPIGGVEGLVAAVDLGVAVAIAVVLYVVDLTVGTVLGADEAASLEVICVAVGSDLSGGVVAVVVVVVVGRLWDSDLVGGTTEFAVSFLSVDVAAEETFDTAIGTGSELETVDVVG